MKTIKSTSIFLISSLIVVFILYQCNEYKEPPLINEPTIDYDESPVISEVIPADSAMAGIRSITIIGDNFATAGGNDTTYVYIGGEPAEVKSITSQEIVIERPTIYGDETTISVMIPRAQSVAQKDYKVEIPI
ncbi:MAG TPA: hypothetical protein ENO27_00445, partial [Caldithrix sp.]|nr:hypothetical protein [Caldithrix sp.]